MSASRQLKRLLASESRRLRREEKQRHRERQKKTARTSSPQRDGASSLPADWFKVVTSEQRRRDRNAAIWDSLFVRLHRFADPFQAYGSKLDQEATLAKSRLQAPKQPTDLEDQEDVEARRLRADAAYEAESIKIYEEIIEKVGSEFHKELESSIDKEIGDIEGIYQTWKDYLGRPSFSERFEDLRSWFAGQKKIEKDPEKKVGWIERFLEWSQSMLAKYAIPTLVPAEIYFAKPGFQFLTPEDKYAALASAIAYAGLLVLSGWALASFIGRATINSVLRQDAGNRVVVTTRVRRWTVATSCLFLFLGFSMSISGAYLRSKIPEISQYFESRTQLISDQRSFEEDASIHGISQEKYEIKEREFRNKNEKLSEEYKRIRYEGFPFFAADSLIAMCIYFAIFMAAFAKRMLSRDPILEYEIVASNLMELKAFKRMIINWREGERRTYLGNIASAKDRLARVRANLGAVAPDDPNALPAAESRLEESEAVEETLSTEEQFAIPTCDEVVASWRALRLQNYTRIYVMLKGGSISRDHANKIPSYLGA